MAFVLINLSVFIYLFKEYVTNWKKLRVFFIVAKLGGSRMFPRPIIPLVDTFPNIGWHSVAANIEK